MGYFEYTTQNEAIRIKGIFRPWYYEGQTESQFRQALRQADGEKFPRHKMAACCQTWLDEDLGYLRAENLENPTILGKNIIVSVSMLSKAWRVCKAIIDWPYFWEGYEDKKHPEQLLEIRKILTPYSGDVVQELLNKIDKALLTRFGVTDFLAETAPSILQAAAREVLEKRPLKDRQENENNLVRVISWSAQLPPASKGQKAIFLSLREYLEKIFDYKITESERYSAERIFVNDYIVKMAETMKSYGLDSRNIFASSLASLAADRFLYLPEKDKGSAQIRHAKFMAALANVNDERKSNRHLSNMHGKQVLETLEYVFQHPAESGPDLPTDLLIALRTSDRLSSEQLQEYLRRAVNKVVAAKNIPAFVHLARAFSTDEDCAAILKESHFKAMLDVATSKSSHLPIADPAGFYDLLAVSTQWSAGRKIALSYLPRVRKVGRNPEWEESYLRFGKALEEMSTDVETFVVWKGIIDGDIPPPSSVEKLKASLAIFLPRK